MCFDFYERPTCSVGNVEQIKSKEKLLQLKSVKETFFNLIKYVITLINLIPN